MSEDNYFTNQANRMKENSSIETAFTSKQGNVSAQKIFEAVLCGFEQQAKKVIKEVGKTNSTEDVKVSQLPLHRFSPVNSESLDIRDAVNIGAATAKTLLFQFVCPVGKQAFITDYVLYNDALNANAVEFIPELNGNRIFRYHGTPYIKDGNINSTRLSLGLTPDLGNGGLVECKLHMKEGDILSWYVVNSDVVAVNMGVRIKGYVNSSLKLTQPLGGE